MHAAPKAASAWRSDPFRPRPADRTLFRLKTRAQFQVVLAERVIAKSEHFALHRHALAAEESPSSGVLLRPMFSPSGLWLGAMVPKRWARRSVTRHAIKRQIYDVAQAMLPAQDSAAYLVRLRTGFSRQQFFSSSSDVLKQAVRAELIGLLARRAPPSPAP